MFSRRIQRLWDFVADHFRSHPRKYGALGFIIVFLPQWVPAAKDAAQWLASIAPAGWGQRMNLSWNWITTPVGFLLMFMVWWETRHRKSSDATHSSSANDTNVSGEEDYRALLAMRAREVESLTNERDGAIQAFGRCKHAFAMARLRWFAQSREEWKIHVTIRFGRYADAPIVKEIERLIRDDAGWPVETELQSKPVLMPHDEFRIVMVTSRDAHDRYWHLLDAIREGPLLKWPVAIRAGEHDDLSHLVIEVLPSLSDGQES
jgi:hypothetical protein